MHFVYPFHHWWTARLLPTSCFPKWSSSEQAHSVTIMNSCESYIYIIYKGVGIPFLLGICVISLKTPLFFVHNSCSSLNSCWKSMTFSVSSPLHKHFIFYDNKMIYFCIFSDYQRGCTSLLCSCLLSNNSVSVTCLFL